MADDPFVSRREDLTRMREVLFASLDGHRQLQRGENSTFAEAAAPLVGQLRQVVRELAELGDEAVVNPVDEIKAKRAARQKKAATG